MIVSDEVAKYWGLKVEKVKHEDQFFVRKDDPDYAEYQISYRSNIFQGFSGASFGTYAYGKTTLTAIRKISSARSRTHFSSTTKISGDHSPRSTASAAASSVV